MYAVGYNPLDEKEAWGKEAVEAAHEMFELVAGVVDGVLAALRQAQAKAEA